jgi:hypothetical protein
LKDSSKIFLAFLLLIATVAIFFSPVAAVATGLAGIPLTNWILGNSRRRKRVPWDGEEWEGRSVKRVIRMKWAHISVTLLVLFVVSLFAVPDVQVASTVIRHDRLLIGGASPDSGRWGGAAAFSYDVRRLPVLENLLSVTIRFNPNEVLMRAAVWSTDGTNPNNDVTYVNFQQVLSNTTFHVPIEKSTPYYVEVSYSPNNVLKGIENSTIIDVTVTAFYTLTWGDILH